MDNRTKEIVEILEEAKRRAELIHGYSSIDKINEALSLLTAEPEPCEDARFDKVARLIVARCLGSLEANPTYIEAVHTLLVQNFAPRVSDKRVEELRDIIGDLLNHWSQKHDYNDFPECVNKAHKALAATDPKQENKETTK